MTENNDSQLEKVDFDTFSSAHKEVSPEYEEVPKELTDEEKHDLYLKQLKESKNRFKTKMNYGVDYKKTRKRKNKLQKASRRKNR